MDRDNIHPHTINLIAITRETCNFLLGRLSNPNKI